MPSRSSIGPFNGGYFSGPILRRILNMTGLHNCLLSVSVLNLQHCAPISLTWAGNNFELNRLVLSAGWHCRSMSTVKSLWVRGCLLRITNTFWEDASGLFVVPSVFCVWETHWQQLLFGFLKVVEQDWRALYCTTSSLLEGLPLGVLAPRHL